MQVIHRLLSLAPQLALDIPHLDNDSTQMLTGSKKKGINKERFTFLKNNHLHHLKH